MEILAVLPTYNEAQNIQKIVSEILSLPLDIAVLVVDDNSPDKTYEIVREMGAKDKRVHLLLRTENRGRGWAGIDGFRKALEMNARYVVEMDADFSHAPKYIPEFLLKINDADIVSGSRYTSGGKDEERSFVRKVISNFARRYLSFVLGLKLTDPTSGYRFFRKEALQKILPYLKARDPFIVAEVFYWAKKMKLRIAESPIEFLPRLAGESKLHASILIKYLFRVWKLRLKKS